METRGHDRWLWESGAAEMGPWGKESQRHKGTCPGKNIQNRANSLCKNFRKSLGNTELVQSNCGMKRKGMRWNSVLDITGGDGELRILAYTEQLCYRSQPAKKQIAKWTRAHVSLHFRVRPEAGYII